LDDYIFGEPKVVLTHTAAIGIARWLPDGERLLIVRSIPGKPREYVETFNVRTGELRRYGERHSVPVKPVWLDKLGKVAFADVSEHQYDLWISDYGQEQAKSEVLSNVEFPVTGWGDKVLIIPREQRQLVAADEGGKRRDAQIIDLAAYGFRPDDVLTYFRMAISLDGERLAVYDREHFVILDLKTGVGQALDLGDGSIYAPGKIWAFGVEWGPDGRYLALKTSIGEPPFGFTELAILDTATGELRTIDLGLRHNVHDFAWAPHGRYLIVMGYTHIQEGHASLGLFLVDVVTGRFRRVLPDYETGTGAWGLDWSTDGKSIALECPTWEEGCICLIPVSIR
jgi:hypothetical protein